MTDPDSKTTAERAGARLNPRVAAVHQGAVHPTTTRDDTIMRALSYAPVDGPYTHRRWWRIEIAHEEQPMGPSGCIQGFTFWLGERALYG